MSAIIKTKLKASRDAIGKKDYEKARDAALAALDYEPENYNANVFLGLSLLELGNADESEQAYLKAVISSPELPLAWQGLVKLYEQSRKLDKYAEALTKLADIYVKANDATKCAETLQKLIQLRREEGDSLEIANALSLLLPGSLYYPTLSALPPPDATNPTASTTSYTQSAIHNSLPILEEIVMIHEKREEATLTKEVDKRRQRIGSTGPAQIRKDVIRELYADSKLPSLYQEILSHPNASDEVRRQAESKLLEHKQQLLFALPNTKEFAAQKKTLSSEVQELVSGMVLIKIPNELAWTLFIEAKDAVSVEEYDLTILAQFVQLFPNHPLAQMVAAYFAYSGIPLDEEEEEEKKKASAEGDEEDHLTAILDLFRDARDSILAHRIAAEVYQIYEEHENTIKVIEDGLEVTLRQEQSQGIKLERVRRGFNVMLANALVHFFPPKHHPRARRIVDEVLDDDPDNIRCLMCRGYILQHEGKWHEATSSFNRVVELLPEDVNDGIRAEEELAWSKAQDADPDRGSKDLKEVLSRLDNLEGREEDQARCWWRLGRCYWDIGDFEEAYRSFIIALKRQASFAPAFTSLGIYYADAASPPDPKRASKCFQKAFELDPREAEAARRLAEGFAEEREWDLVEVVARRTVEGEGGLEGGADGAVAAMYQPLNAWAWKAIGVVELNRGRYPQAIRALQIALRTDTEDALSWLRLGEAYSKAFRLAAALKALERARELNPSDWIASYFLAEVYRQMGQYQQAIDAFIEILQQEPKELRVLLSLAQTHLEYGRAEETASFTRRAEASFVNAIDVVLDVVDNNPGFRRIAWKTASDALYELSKLADISEPEHVMEITTKVVSFVSGGSKGKVAELVPLDVAAADSTSSTTLLSLAIHAYSYRISLGSLDDPSAASAMYDLSVALVSYAQRKGAGESEAIREEALRCLKDALGLDPLNEKYWHTLGDLYFTSRPKLAQHAYVKALEIDNKSFATWTNLGMLYLYHNDLELANEAFYRAQVLNPDFPLAWVGQGLVATANEHHPQAFSLFEHAVGLQSTTLYADIAFARRLFDRLKTSPSRDISPESFIPAFFVLDRFVRRCPQDPTALHLFGLVCERIGHTQLATSVITQAIEILEAVYEETEDVTVERQFTLAHANLGRLRLSAGDYEAAVTSFETVTGLLAESTDPSTAVPLVQAHLGAGLANFKLGAIREAVQSFEAASEAAGDNSQLRSHAVVLLAQALWALGTPDAREAAKTQLLESIEIDPENLQAIGILGGMGILTADDGLVDAALSELLSAPLEQRLQRDPARDVPYLLAQHHLAQGDIEAAKAVVQKTVALEPARSRARWHLATLALQSGEPRAARGVLDGAAEDANGEDDVRHALWLNAACEAIDGDGTAALAAAQRAVKLAPWDRRSWLALGLARTNGA